MHHKGMPAWSRSFQLRNLPMHYGKFGQKSCATTWAILPDDLCPEASRRWGPGALSPLKGPAIFVERARLVVGWVEQSCVAGWQVELRILQCSRHFVLSTCSAARDLGSGNNGRSCNQTFSYSTFISLSDPIRSTAWVQFICVTASYYSTMQWTPKSQVCRDRHFIYHYLYRYLFTDTRYCFLIFGNLKIAGQKHVFRGKYLLCFDIWKNVRFWKVYRSK